MKVELRVLRTISEEPESRAAKEFLAKLDETHFASEVARATFKRIRQGLRRSSTVPSWEELYSDPALDESIQEVLEECDTPPLTSKKRVRGAIERLQEYKKLRLLTKIGKRLEEVINGTEPISADLEIGNIQESLNNAKATGQFKVLRIGANSNVMKSVDRMLKGTSITYLPTGFDGFDGINKGIPDGAFHLIAAPTGAGKSALLNQLMENYAKAGAKVGLAPLEMSNDEMLQRNMARVGQLDLLKLLDPVARLARKEHEAIREKMQKYDRKILKAGGALEYYEFDEGVTIETLTSTVEPFGLDVLGIDYLGLLEGVGGDNQWQHLMDCARYLHIWGKAKRCRTVAAAQLSEDGALRYSKGLAEHAKFFWYWTVDEVAKETGIYEIIQRKARQASDHNFMLQFHLPTMTIKDATAEAIKAAGDRRKEGLKGKKGESGDKKWKKEGSLSWDEDEDEPKPRPGKNAQKHNINKHGKKHKAKKEIEL